MVVGRYAPASAVISIPFRSCVLVVPSGINDVYLARNYEQSDRAVSVSGLRNGGIVETFH